MKILAVTALVIPDVVVVRFERFADARGYFTEPYRRSDVESHPELQALAGVSFPQANESYSRAGVIRGLHFQWNPFMGKLVRTVSGRMVDLFLDIRLGSPTFGKIGALELSTSPGAPASEWIWVPPGFAHGNYFTEDTIIEYFCSGEYSPGCEAGISPLAEDLDWSLCPQPLGREFRALVESKPTISDKDRSAPSLAQWASDPRANTFRYGELGAGAA